MLVDDILYITRLDRKVILVTRDEEYRPSQSYDELCQLLPAMFFYPVHKSFYVNLNYVNRYAYSELNMIDGTRIPVSPRRMTGGRCLLSGFLLFAAGSVVNLIFCNNGVLDSAVTVLLNSLFACLCFRNKLRQGIFYSVILGIVNAALETVVVGLFSVLTGNDVLEHNRNLPLLIVECSACKGLFFPVVTVICQTTSWYILIQPSTAGKTQVLLAVSSVLLLFATVLLFITYQDQIRKDRLSRSRMRWRACKQKRPTTKF